MPLLQITVLVLYFSTMALLAAYGVHRLHLLYLLYRHRPMRTGPHPAHRCTPGCACGTSPPKDSSWPAVTIQIPIYNELNVASRILEAVCRMDYPPERLEIQVLDDS